MNGMRIVFGLRTHSLTGLDGLELLRVLQLLVVLVGRQLIECDVDVIDGPSAQQIRLQIQALFGCGTGWSPMSGGWQGGLNILTLSVVPLLFSYFVKIDILNFGMNEHCA